MKLFSFFIRPFYNVEVRDSEAQLRLDFAHFPPAPLRCGSLKSEFNVIRARGVGNVYVQVIFFARFLKALETDPQSLSEELMRYVGVDFVHSLRQVLDWLNRCPKFVKSIVISMMILSGGLITAVSMRNRPKGMGMFMPLFGDESNVLIRSARFKDRSDESVVSHEHVHFLQHRNAEPHSRYVKCPEMLMSETYAVESSCLYLFEKDEVEARLHEVVLSFYRKHRYLPLSVPSFLGIIAASSQFDWLVNKLLNSKGVSFEKEIGAYPDRDSMLTEQLLFVLQWIKTDDLRVRFLTEVLTVMYGNLLRYYGDDAASRDFHVQIPRPNYYDELYGV